MKLRALGALFLALLLGGGGAQPQPAPEAPLPVPEPPVYAIISKEKSNPYMQNMADGFSAACRELGAEALCMGPDSYTAQAQIDIIDALIDRKVDAIVIAANDSDELQDALQRAMDEGIAVLSLDSAVNRESRMLHIQQADPEKIGRVLIQAACKMVDGEGKAAVLSATRQATNQNLWIEWMQREIEQNPSVYAKFELLPVAYGDDEPEKSREETLRLFEENPDLKVIISPSVVGMLAVGQTLQEEESPVLFTGLGLPSEIAPYIESGSCPWMYLWNPIDLGYLSAYAADGLATGRITGREGDNLTAGRLGLRVVVDAEDGGTELLLGDPVKFDPDNIGEWKSVY